MSRTKNIRLVLLFVSSIGVLIIYYISYYERESFKLNVLDLPRILRWTAFDQIFFFVSVCHRSTKHGGSRSQKLKKNDIPGYVISRSNCKMLDPNPWDESIERYLMEPRPITCSRLPLLTYIDERKDFTNVLNLNKKIVSRYKTKPNHSIRCCYSIISRISQSVQDYNISADSLYELSNCTHFEDQVELSNTTEFILVNCQSVPKGKAEGKLVYKNVHPVVPILPEVKPKMRRENSENVNVLILGIDSVSKLNLRRTMPRTLKFLQENNWVELKGYNKIGENTFPNLMAILSGEPIKVLEKKCWSNRTQKMDDCPYIWKEYDRKGYVTLYAEDTPAISTFNLARTGFVRKPTDYYMRPFMLAGHDLLKQKVINGLPVCLGPVLIVDHVFNYARRFLRVFNNHNHFALLWLNSLSHNDVNTPRVLDISVHKFLQELTKIGTYENTMVLLLSDHGARFGNIREAFLGFLEERLPFLFIWTPKRFRDAHPQKYNNLVRNQYRVTSPFDVYVTIRGLLDNTNAVSTACPKCKSLLEVQPIDRSCADASIDVNWCLCSQFRSISTRSEPAKQIGDFLYNYIVQQTEDLIEKANVTRSLCSKWKFQRVFRSDEIILPNIPQQYSLRNIRNMETERFENTLITPDTKMFVIIIELNPGKTKFESTVRMQTKVNDSTFDFDLLEPPKRLDSIYKTSKCVSDLLLKHYCYCVKR